ncbi:hypothetical protein [Hyphobacterium sp.]|uniref:hypothetical protein n=1 Tax=Hyphobacterium sp. TaxID=2004662 RepID=UPI003B52D059
MVRQNVETSVTSGCSIPKQGGELPEGATVRQAICSTLGEMNLREATDNRIAQAKA